MTRYFTLKKVYLALLGATICFWFIDWEWLSALETVVYLAFCVLTLVLAFRLTRKLFRKLLWRIRRKLILSYIFIGFIPIFLLVILFLLGSFIFLGQTTSEMFSSNLDGLLLQTKNEGEKLLHLSEYLPDDEAHSKWFHELSPSDAEWLKEAEITVLTGGEPQSLQGHQVLELPGWVYSADFSGLVLRDSMPYLAAVHHDQAAKKTLQILVPVRSNVLELIKKKINADIYHIPLASEGAKNELQEAIGSSKRQPVWPKWWDFPIWWFSLPDQYDWETGKRIAILENDKDSSDSENSTEVSTPDKGIQFEANLPEGSNSMRAFVVSTHFSRVYGHIFSRSTALQKFVYAVMFSVAVLFMIIELISLISGFLLAKSITASVHNLFEGTERIKKGDLNYQIRVGAPDQLGELAQSFNNMTDSIKDLLKERAEKERLAESLRIARQMQQNLLPKEVTSFEGLDIATMNIPAQEVCGDYYDILSNDSTMGVIIADVSGKGPSAALYMAEVKGVILSVSRQTSFPRELLVEANRILGPTLDPRNFITMTYAKIEVSSGLFKVSRAGHNPILHYSAQTESLDIVQPSGIGLGLGKNGIFEKTLEEVERKTTSGDILVFYTDGLTEAMNEKNELYGLQRLSDIILRQKNVSTEQMKTAIMRDLEVFLQGEAPQDDITLVLVKFL